jgi:RsiW-degrading membrane proteinase PrsW (M82 family)
MTLALVILLISIFAVARLVLLIKTDHSKKEPVLMLWMAAGLGAIALNAASILEFLLIPNQILFAVQDGIATLPQALYASGIIGVVEELCKFLPLMILIHRKHFFNEFTDGIIYFAIAGQTFGLLEDINYTISHGEQAGIARLFITPFFHMGTTAIIGFFLARHKILKKTSWLSVLFPLIFVILAHVIYDFGLLSGRPEMTVISLAITGFITVAVIGLLLHAHHLDKKMHLSDFK